MPKRPAERAPGDVLVHLRRARDLADRSYAEPFDLDRLAAAAGLSKWHFLRLFRATYGLTPADYVSRRRIERAQDLLRATNLTVTEVCHAVGFSSLGSFSSRFRAVVGESPSAFQDRWSRTGAPRIPGCYVFMWGLAERAGTASSADLTYQEGRRSGTDGAARAASVVPDRHPTVMRSATQEKHAATGAP